MISSVQSVLLLGFGNGTVSGGSGLVTTLGFGTEDGDTPHANLTLLIDRVAEVTCLRGEATGAL